MFSGCPPDCACVRARSRRHPSPTSSFKFNLTINTEKREAYSTFRCSEKFNILLFDGSGLRIALADLGFLEAGDFGNPSERSERALRGSGLTGE